MEDRLNLEREIEEHERELAEAAQRQAEADQAELDRVQKIKDDLKAKREALINAHRRVEQWNK